MYDICYDYSNNTGNESVVTRKNLDQMYAKYSGNLFNYAFTILHNIEDAHDIVHDLFCNLYEKIADARIYDTSFRSYLYVAVKNSAISRIKANNRNTVLHDTHTSQTDEAEKIHSIILHDEISLFIQKTFSPEMCRIFSLRIIHGLVWKDISESTGLSPSTVYRIFNTMTASIRKKFPDVL
jgi:RNA polymerase sigma factor (sigma-70 family)